jgi:hypothetical protein
VEDVGAAELDLASGLGDLVVTDRALAHSLIACSVYGGLISWG